MRSMRQRLAAVTLLSGLTLLGVGFTAGPASAAVDEYCHIIGDPQSGSLQMTSDPAPGSDVEPGSTIDFAATWDAGDFEETDRLVICASVAGTFNGAMSSQYKSLDNDGQESGSATIPGSLPPGTDVCFVGGVKGAFTGGDPSQMMVSETHCFRVAAAATTTTTMAPTTTTTAAPVVEPQVIEAGTPSAPAVEAAPAVEPAPLPVLPRTGAGIELLVSVGGLAVAAGGVARFFGRRGSAEG
ncbi:MAG: hypothetical protein AB1679_12980 [Actinomycetota bacterium]